MDAFAVALTQGARFRPSWRGGAAIAVTFGVFQGVMPILGWGIGSVAFSFVATLDHWIAFAILAILGVRMLIVSDDESGAIRAMTARGLLVAGIATSIDALAAGITFPTLSAPPLIAALIIGLVTLLLSGVGVVLGRSAGDRFGAWAERAGGVILIALGVKILAEHTGYL